MAFEVGAIKGVFALDDKFSKPMLSIYDSVNKTLTKVAEIPKIAGDAARKTAQEVSKASNTINGMSDRVQRLQNLLNKSQVGSVRFENLSKALRESQKELDKTTGSLNKMNPALAMAGSALAAFSAVGIVKGIVDITARFEKYQVVLTKTLGSQTDAVKAMDMIAKVAAKTPFSVDKLTDSFVKFANRGVRPSAEEIERLGDVASVVGKDFDQLTEAILDVSNSERWKELGIVSEQAGNKLRLSFKGVTVEGEKTVQGAKDLVVQLGKMQGVLGANDAISNSVVGKFSNLGDAVDALYLSVGKQLLPILTRAVEVLIDITTAISGFIERNKEAIKIIATFTSIIVAGVAAVKTYQITVVALQTVMAAFPGIAARAGAAMAVAFGPGSIALLAVAALATTYLTLKRNIEAVEDARLTAQQAINKEIVLNDKLDSSTKARIKSLREETKELLKGNLNAQQTEDYRIKLSALLTTLDKYGVTRAQITKGDNVADIGRLDKILKINDQIKTQNRLLEEGAILKDKADKGSGGPGFDFLPSRADIQAFGSEMEAAFGQVSKFASAAFDQMAARLGNKLQNVLNKGKIFDLLSDVYTRKQQEANQKELESYTALQNKELEAFKARQEAEIELERKRANESIAILSDEYIRRKELSDQEFADKKAKADLEFQNFVALEQMKFEAQREKIAQESADKEQRQIADALLQEDWKRYLESLEAGHNENLLLISQQKTDADTTLQAEEDKKRQDLQAANDAHLVELEKQKADKIAQAEADKEERIFRKQEEIKAKEKESNKKIALVKYAIDSAALQVQKQIARAQATMAFAMGTMQAVAMAPQTFGASLALIPLMASTYGLTLSSIAAQFVTPPAELFLNQGGIVPGAGMSDTVPARLTPGEMVVDRSTTQGLREMVADGGNKGNIQIIFQPGAIVNNGAMDDRAMDALSFEISRRLERSQSRG